MAKLDMEAVHQRLTAKIKEYIGIIFKEYGDFIPNERINQISTRNLDSVLRIHDYGEISAYANNYEVSMPLCADKLLNIASKIPGYGINKNHKPYNENNMVINNNTFVTYIMHVFISGTNAEGYYDDLLLHEVMHYCGSDGSSVLKEGINELLTRMLAQKYDLRTNSCGYPKEVRLAYELMNAFGEDTIKGLAFIKGFDKEQEYIREKLGDEAAKLYTDISVSAEKEFDEKYYSHMEEFSGALGIAKKVLFYNRLDYSNEHQMIQKYINNLSVSNDDFIR